MMTSKQLVPKGKKSGGGQLSTQNDYLARMNEMFLIPSRSDKHFMSPLVHVADTLRAGGFAGDNLRAALLTMVILNSARLNRKMAEFLVCRELSIPRTIISQCLEMIPAGCYRESTIHDRKYLIAHFEEMNGQVLVSKDPEGFKRVISDLVNIIEHGYTTVQAEAKSSFGTELRERKIDPVLSLLGVATGFTDNLAEYPGALYVPTTEQLDKSSIRTMGERELSDFKFKQIFIRKSLMRMRPTTVDIPFLKCLADHIEKQSPATPEKIIRIVIDTLSLCTIINNPPPFTDLELMANVVGMSPEEFSSYTSNTRIEHPKDRFITASKVDYYMAWVLLKELIPIGSGFLTERQIRVFEALKKYCLDIVHSTFAKKNDPVDQLSTLMNNEDSWPGRDKLYELVNQPGAGGITESTLHNELDVLLKARLIVRVKVGKNKYLYRVNTFDSLKYIDLPHPREIKDPIYNGKKVRVVDPLTNIVEEI
jgi:hypothetical protein